MLFIEMTPMKKIARAQHLAETNREVKSLLFSHKDQTVPEKDTNNADMTAEKNRKLSRLHAVRQKEGVDNKVNTIMVRIQSSPSFICNFY